MLPIPYLKLFIRLFFRRICPTLSVVLCIYILFFYHGYSNKRSYHTFTSSIIDSTTLSTKCNFKPSTDEFIAKYKPNETRGTQFDSKRAEPTIERLRTLLEVIRSKEDKYQSLLETFDVFNMITPTVSLKAYTDESNIEEIRTLYNRYIKLMPDNQTIKIDETFVDYLKQISSYLSDGLRNKRTKKFQVDCYRKPVFVLACNHPFFNALQGTIRTLDTHWSDHQIIFYDLGISPAEKQLLRETCEQCTIIDFPFTSIANFAPHIRALGNYGFKAFVIQDALRRYGTIIYGDSSARYNGNSFNPVLVDNYIRGFAARELPGHYLPCYTHSATFTWFNQSYKDYDDIYMAEANFLVVTDTFLTRLIMKAWLTCSLEPECLITHGSPSRCSRDNFGAHRYDQSAMVIILTHFFFQGNKGTWGTQRLNDPASYDMFTSVQDNLGDIKRLAPENGYLKRKKI